MTVADSDGRPLLRTDFVIFWLTVVHLLISIDVRLPIPGLSGNTYTSSTEEDWWTRLQSTNTEPSTRPVLAVIAILGWVRILFLAKVHQNLGPLVTIFQIMMKNVINFCVFVMFIFMGWGTAFLLVELSSPEVFNSGGAAVYRMVSFGLLGEGMDEVSEELESGTLQCLESGKVFEIGSTAGFECAWMVLEELLLKLLAFLMSVVFMNLLIAMLSQTYEEVVEESQLRWRLLLAQTTLEYYENVHSIWELAPLNVVVLPLRLLAWVPRSVLPWCRKVECCVTCLKQCATSLDLRCTSPASTSTVRRLTARAPARRYDPLDEESALSAPFRPPWRRLPSEVDISWKYGGKTRTGHLTKSGGRRSLYLVCPNRCVGAAQPVVDVITSCARAGGGCCVLSSRGQGRRGAPPTRRDQRRGSVRTPSMWLRWNKAEIRISDVVPEDARRPMTLSDPNATMSSREEDSHPQACGRLMLWRSSELDANHVANRDLHDVTPRKATRQQVRGAEGDYEDDLLSSDTDPQPGYEVQAQADGSRLFQPVKLGEYALPVIASEELYEAQSVREDARVYFNSVRRCP